MRSGYTLAVVGVAIVAAGIALYSTQPLKGSNLQMQMLTDDEMDYIRYVTKYGKAYSTSEEYGRRALIFKENKAKIAQANARNGLRFGLGVNKFTDWSKEEYKALLKYKGQKATRCSSPVVIPEDGELPKRVDWRDHNAVNDVQDQG